MEKVKKKEIWRFIKFLLFSVSAGIIQIGSFTLMTEFIVPNWNYWIRYTISLVLSVIWNFTFNRKFTFKSANNVPIAMLLVFAYYLVFTPCSIFLGDWLVKGCHWNDYLVEAINMVLNFVTEFLWQKYVVFRKSIDQTEKIKQEKIDKEKLEKENTYKESTDERIED